MKDYMKRNPYYILKMIGDSYYLMPFGQAIEMHAPNVCVNEVTAFLWSELDRCEGVKSLAARLMEEYEVEPEESASVEADVRDVLQELMKIGVVLENVYAEEKTLSTYIDDQLWCAIKKCIDRGVERDMEIAGLSLRYFGKAEYFSENFEPFCTYKRDGFLDEHKTADICIIVTEALPQEMGNVSLVLKGMTVTVYDAGDIYVMKSWEAPAMREAHFFKDGSKMVIYMNPHVESNDLSRFALSGWGEASKSILEDEWKKMLDIIKEMTPADCVFHVIRHAFLLKAQKLGMYVIHSASIFYEGKAWLFSAHSGVGKSTHTNIWHKLYGTPYLDGDLNLLAFENEKVVVKGIPWCGTSGIFTTEEYQVGGIILLKQDQRNFMEDLRFDKQVIGIQMRFISPKWDEIQTAESIDFAERIAKAVRIVRLHCNMEDEAAQVCKAWIDN